MAMNGPTGSSKGPKGYGNAVNAGDKRMIPNEKPKATPVNFNTRDKTPPTLVK